jgi:hypothetical protein
MEAQTFVRTTQSDFSEIQTTLREIQTRGRVIQKRFR